MIVPVPTDAARAAHSLRTDLQIVTTTFAGGGTTPEALARAEEALMRIRAAVSPTIMLVRGMRSQARQDAREVERDRKRMDASNAALTASRAALLACQEDGDEFEIPTPLAWAAEAAGRVS